MATIHDLNTSITEMDDQTLTDLIMQIRANRRVRPIKRTPNAQAKRTIKRKRQPKQQDIFALAANMSDKQKAALVAQLTGNKNENT
jgi:hypothetical protein